MKPLTALAVERIKPCEKRVEIPDALAPGLYLVVQRSGYKSWAVRYRLNGRTAKHTIGRFPAFDLARARIEARAVLEDVQRGKAPKQAHADAAAAAPRTFAWLGEQFVERYAKGRKRTWREDERNLRGEFADWAARTASEISKGDILELLEKKAKSAPIRARRLFALVRKLFSWAVEVDLLAESPAASIKTRNLPGKERSRDRVLRDDELLALQRALERLEWPWAPIITLALLTGQRRGECAGVRWQDLDLDARVWTLPSERTKAGRVHDVPLTEELVQLIEKLPRFERSAFVFPAAGSNYTAASGFSKAKARLDRLMVAELAKMSAMDGKPHAFADWRVHDLRRTCATVLQRLNVQPHVVSALLNHSPGQTISTVTQVYARHRYSDERRAALEAWGNYLAALREKKNRNNVVPITRRVT
jgi:integrase